MRAISSVTAVMTVGVSLLCATTSAEAATSVTTMTSSAPTAYARYGADIAQSYDGQTALVGKPAATDATGKIIGPGRVAVWTKSSTGAWAASLSFQASDATIKDGFGATLALSGDGTTAAISGGGTAADATGSQGAVYIFRHSGSTWTQTARLTASGGPTVKYFGAHLAISADGNRLVVSDGCAGTNCQGAAFIFTRSGSTWTKSFTLLGEADAGLLGASVAVSGDGTTVAVGEPSNNTVNPSTGRKTYTPTVRSFKYSGTGWAILKPIVDPGGSGSTGFGGDGLSLSSDGTQLLGGNSAASYLSGTAVSGVIYLFTYSSGAWGNPGLFTRPAVGTNPPNAFGSSVALSPDGLSILAGEPDGDGTGARGAGALYLYKKDLSTGTWLAPLALKAPGGAPYEGFGYSVDLSAGASQPFAGANSHATNGVPGAGAAYMFKITP